ncbi:hypothetical protein BREVNS_0552 [Brevinematales bacterium NS]|nr:hypothetical protein BREVNS_0552 [Brevinematales bacterium NS]
MRSPTEEGLSLGSGISHYPQKRPMFRPRRMRSMRRGQGPSGAGAGAGRGFTGGVAPDPDRGRKHPCKGLVLYEWEVTKKSLLPLAFF